MKILCETQVLNRQTQVMKSPRAGKATLALGYNNSSQALDITGRTNNKELELIHFTPQNKLGVRYKVRDNIEKMFTKFLQDGKVTISFRQPPDNLMIKCDPIQLKGFLQALKLGLEGKDSTNIRLNVAAATAIPPKAQPQYKLTILQRSDYPAKGLPKSLKHLTISGIQLFRITFDISSLRYLTSLNLSYNNITKIPAEVGRLSLTECHVNNNMLGELNSWQWLRGKPLQKSLRDLDISANKLCYMPHELVKFEQLITLKLNNNSIQRLPFGVRRMHSMRYLHLASNELEALPACFNYMRLDQLDVWGNNFQQQSKQTQTDEHIDTDNIEIVSPDTTETAPPLWVIAARAVCQYKLPYDSSTLPWVLVDIMSESPQCACGKLCYASDSMMNCAALATFSNVKSLVFSRDRLIYADVVLCGPNCTGKRQLLGAEN